MNLQVFPLILSTIVASSLIPVLPPSLAILSYSDEANSDEAIAADLKQLPRSPQQTRPRRSPVRVSFNPPRRGAPPATVGLGSRGDCIENRFDSLRALVPGTLTDATTEASTLGLTITASPTLFVYVPAYNNAAQSLSLRLMRVVHQDQEEEVYSQAFALPPSPGLVALPPTGDTFPPLTPGQQYHWYVSLVCNSLDQSGNASVDGWIERIVPPSSLSSNLTQVSPLDQAALYGEAGLWHDLLLTLAELRRTQPTNPEWQTTWQEVLRSVGLGAIADAPLVECCQPLD